MLCRSCTQQFGCQFYCDARLAAGEFVRTNPNPAAPLHERTTMVTVTADTPRAPKPLSEIDTCMDELQKAASMLNEETQGLRNLLEGVITPQPPEATTAQGVGLNGTPQRSPLGERLAETTQLLLLIAARVRSTINDVAL